VNKQKMNNLKINPFMPYDLIQITGALFAMLMNGAKTYFFAPFISW